MNLKRKWHRYYKRFFGATKDWTKRLKKAKHELSSSTETEINIPFITSDADGPKHLLMKFSRAKLEDLVKEYIDKSIEITKSSHGSIPI